MSIPVLCASDDRQCPIRQLWFMPEISRHEGKAALLDVADLYTREHAPQIDVETPGYRFRRWLRHSDLSCTFLRYLPALPCSSRCNFCSSVYVSFQPPLPSFGNLKQKNWTGVFQLSILNFAEISLLLSLLGVCCCAQSLDCRATDPLNWRGDQSVWLFRPFDWKRILVLEGSVWFFHSREYTLFRSWCGY